MKLKNPDWLANMVLVKKLNRKWRMRVDYSSLNSSCPKDSCPLPNIDQLIDAFAGHVMLSFIDAFMKVNIGISEKLYNIRKLAGCLAALRRFIPK